MVTKAQLNDDGTVSDSVTKENQKGYANYEADNTKRQREMETKDAKMKESVKTGVEKIRGMMGFKKGGVAKTVTKEMEYDYKSGKKSFAGTTAQRDRHAEKEGKRVAKDLAYDKSMGMKSGGKVSSASKRADGIAIRGKTRA